MAWTSVGASGSFDDSAPSTSSGFADASTSNTTATNSSRFIAYRPIDSSLVSLGIDFSLTINSVAPFVLLSTSSLVLTSSADSRY